MQLAAKILKNGKNPSQISSFMLRSSTFQFPENILPIKEASGVEGFPLSPPIFGVFRVLWNYFCPGGTFESTSSL